MDMDMRIHVTEPTDYELDPAFVLRPINSPHGFDPSL